MLLHTLRYSCIYSANRETLGLAKRDEASKKAATLISLLQRSKCVRESVSREGRRCCWGGQVSNSYSLYCIMSDDVAGVWWLSVEE